MTTNKPRTRDGYTPEDLANVISACLTFAVTVGAHMDELCIVGGLVPSLLIDHRLGTPNGAAHPGTNDLDVGLAVAVLGDNGYHAISTRLRAEGFEPIKNARGNTQVQTWAYASTKVTVDFLIGHASQHDGIIARALTDLSRDFREPTNHGPMRAAAFDTLRAGELDDAAADAHGYVDDLLRRCRAAGLSISG